MARGRPLVILFEKKKGIGRDVAIASNYAREQTKDSWDAWCGKMIDHARAF